MGDRRLTPSAGIDARCEQQAVEPDRKRHQTILCRMQQLVFETTVVAPLRSLAS